MIVAFSVVAFGMDASVYYSQSQNFQPGSGRVDVFGAPLADPNGKTKDYGFVVSILDQKVTLKVNKFESKILNATSGLDNEWYIGQGLERGYVFDQFYKNNFVYWRFVFMTDGVINKGNFDNL